MAFLVVIIYILAFFCVLTLYRILKGPSIWDRMLGLNLLTAKIIMMMILYADIENTSLILDTALFYALLSFIGVLFIAFYVQKKGRY